ncbi:MAG: flippase-like domain-containing protein, partial [Muribaculaceae bacterium]|nr:flippase-like domain-containing protein [Muribaculaceae bacterium]
FALPLLLVGYMFKKVDFAEMWNLISHGVDYWWILAAMFISIFSHISRAARWRIQLRSLGINAPMLPLCCSIFGCYALNLVFPRLGEVWRCSYISGREKAPFTTVLGSMVADRVCDTLVVLGLTFLAFLIATPAIESFLVKYPIGKGLVDMLTGPYFWIIAVAVCIGVWLLLRFGKDTKFVKMTVGWVKNLWSGFAAILKMEGKWEFLLLTLAIWGCYFIQLYVAFFAFDFTRNLCHDPALGYGLVPCLVAFVLSSIGMAVPSNGGLGPWNIAVMFGLAVYGIGEAEGTAFSMLQWSGQTVMLIILGVFTMVYISRDKAGLRRERREKRG